MKVPEIKGGLRTAGVNVTLVDKFRFESATSVHSLSMQFPFNFQLLALKDFNTIVLRI